MRISDWSSDVCSSGLMERMPYTPEMDAAVALLPQAAPESVVTTDWRTGLPVLTGSRVTLRELRVSDAHSLFAMLTTEEVDRKSAVSGKRVSGGVDLGGRRSIKKKNEHTKKPKK